MRRSRNVGSIQATPTASRAWRDRSSCTALRLPGPVPYRLRGSPSHCAALPRLLSNHRMDSAPLAALGIDSGRSPNAPARCLYQCAAVGVVCECDRALLQDGLADGFHHLFDSPNRETGVIIDRRLHSADLPVRLGKVQGADGRWCMDICSRP